MNCERCGWELADDEATDEGVCCVCETHLAILELLGEVEDGAAS